MYFEKLDKQGYYLIAEAGVNYYELAEKYGVKPIEAAKMMVKIANECGADAIKFQTYKAERLTRKDSPGSWSRDDVNVETMYEMFKMYDHFGEKEYAELSLYSRSVGIDFMSTPFDEDAIEYLDNYMDVYKISSSDITNDVLIEQIAKKNKPVILSVGASDKSEIDNAISIIKKYNDNKITLMHCMLEYPTPYEHANLNKITTLRSEYPEMVIGYSDHTKPDIEMDVLKTAFIMGARTIEKHFTLDKSIKGRNDHFHSMDGNDIKKVKKAISFINTIQGNGELRCLETEIRTRNSVRRSAVLLQSLQKGDILEKRMVTYIRPGDGMSYKDVVKLFGKRAKRDLVEHTLLKADDFE